MMEMKFNSQICTSKSQSERLLALGLKIETANCYYWQETDRYGDGNGKWHCEILSEYNKDHNEYLYNVCGVDGSDEGFFIPAWSLGRLIEMMPFDVIPEGGFDNCFTLIKNYPKGYSVEYDGFSYYYKENIYDTLINAIEHLIKEGYFNKEYLEE